MIVTASKAPQNPRIPGQHVGWGGVKLKDFTQYLVHLSNTHTVNVLHNHYVLLSLILNSK